MHTDVAIIVGAYQQDETLPQAYYSAKEQIIPYDSPWPDELPTFQVVVTIDRIGIGSAKARNQTIKEIDADWIIWLDADDLLPSNYLHEMWHHRQHAYIPRGCKGMLVYSAAQFISGARMDRFDGLDLTRTTLMAEAISHQGHTKMRYKLPMAMSAMFSKNSWLTVGGFDEELTNTVDLDFWIRLCDAGYIFTGTKNTYLFRRNTKPFPLGNTQEQHIVNSANCQKSLARFENKHGIRLTSPFVPYLIPATDLL